MSILKKVKHKEDVRVMSHNISGIRLVIGPCQSFQVMSHNISGIRLVIGPCQSFRNPKGSVC